MNNDNDKQEGDNYETNARTLERTSLLGSYDDNGSTTMMMIRPCCCGHSCFAAVALCIVVLLILLAFSNNNNNTSNNALYDSTIDIEHDVPKRTYSQIQAIYHQDRPMAHLGTSNAYAGINEEKLAQRVENMRQLEMIRSGHCGSFPAPAGRREEDTDSNWKVHPTSLGVYHHCENGATYKERYRRCNGAIQLERFVCEAPHPVLLNVTVTLERFGPFNTTGGYDWSIVDDTMDIGMLQQRYLAHHNVTFIGGMAAVVHRNGTLVSYPPIHIHHAHIFPYGDDKERAQKIHGSTDDHHDLMFQSHGDSECLAKEGGDACLLQQYENGKGFVVTNATTGISANFELNDVRPMNSPAMEYWFEIALLHSTTVPPPQRKSAFIGLNNPCVGPGPCTYAMPMDPHDNVIWYQYTHGTGHSDLPSGYMSDFILHTHQTMFDSAFVIRAPDDSVVHAFEAFARGKKHFPLILDCHGVTLADAKADLLSRIALHGGTVICEATKPSVLLLPNDEVNENDDNNNNNNNTLSSTEWSAFDKRSQLNCLQEPVPLNLGDRLVVLAFNTVHESKYTRQSHAFLRQNAFGNDYAAYQHTIFRFALTRYNAEVSHDDNDDDYMPPSWFYYASGDLAVDIFGHPDWWITSTCPASIKYRMDSKKGWLSSWLRW